MEVSSQYEAWRNTAATEDLLQDGYSDRLFFHVYEHALATREIARELGKWVAYEEQKKPLGERREVDFYVLDWAALGHDYGYLQYVSLPQSVKSRYPSREKYAAAMVGGLMASAGAPAEKVRAVKEAIWSTEAGVPCTTLEGRILRQADLANVGSPNQANFFINTVRLYREYRLFNHRDPQGFHPREFIGHALMNYRILSRYNAEDVSLGDFDREADGRSKFCRVVSENMQFLLPERIKTLATIAGSTLLKDFDPGTEPFRDQAVF